jgi:Methyltransferase domain
MKEIHSCGISNGKQNFQKLLALPKFPLTEAFGKYDTNFVNYNQELVMSMDSGHVQLKYQIDPITLYDERNYAFRAGEGIKSTTELQFLMKFMEETLDFADISHALEIGANDLKLSRLLKNVFISVSACDPLLIKDHGKYIDGIEIIGLPIEKAFKETKFTKPDLVILRHTLEHISEPKLMIESLLEFASKECIFVIEVPSLKHIAEALRFDAIFHQHYHYFDIESAKTLMAEIGCEIINHTYNNQGSNGGSLIFAFKKSRTKLTNYQYDLHAKFDSLKKRIDLYKHQMSLLGTIIDELPGPKFGFGAGLMVATLD